MRKVFLFISIFMSIKLIASEQLCYELSNKNTVVEINELNRTIIIHKLMLDVEVLGGQVSYTLEVPYDLPDIEKVVSDKKLITFTGDDFNEGSGMDVIINIDQANQCAIAFRLQYEDMALFYSPNSLVIKHKKCSTQLQNKIK